MNIELLRGMDNVTLAKTLMNLNNKMMKEILKMEGIKKLYKMKKDQLQDCILELVYQTSMFSNIEPVAATEEPEVIEIDEEVIEVLPAIMEEQELISQDKFKEIMNYVLNDDLVGLTNGKVTKFNVELVLNCLNSEETFGYIFSIDSSDGHYNAAAYNELLCKMMDMNNEVLTNIANYGFEYLSKAIEGFKNHDSNNPPF